MENNLKLLKKLISIKSDTNIESNKQGFLFFKSFFEEKNINYKILSHNQKKHLIASLNCNFSENQSIILLASHFDTVCSNNTNWTYDPYTLHIEGDKLIGLGTCDMKSFIYIVLKNIKNIRKINTPIFLSISFDEEDKMIGSKEISSFLNNNNILPYLTIVGEPSNNNIALKNNGYFEVEYHIEGKSAHSSSPELGINAIYVASKIISYIEEVSLKLNIPINVGKISGGSVTNVVPHNCVFNCDFRSDDYVAIKKVIESINNYISKLMNNYKGVSIFQKELIFIPPFKEDKEKIFQTFPLLKKKNIIDFAATSEAGIYKEISKNVIIFGPGNIDNAHISLEYITYSSIKEYEINLLDLLEKVSNV